MESLRWDVFFILICVLIGIIIIVIAISRS
jgi:hypothetical protein